MAITKILARKGRLDVGINYVLNGDKTQERVLTAHLNCDPGREHLPGYEVVIAVHVDRQHIHGHLIFNSVNADTGEKYHSNAQTYYSQIRAVSDRLCREHGLSVVMAGQPSQAVSCAEWPRQSKGQLTFRTMLEADLRAALESANDLGHFYLLMEHMGYEIYHGNRLGFRLRGQERFMYPGRGNGLFTEEGIRAAIEGNLSIPHRGNAGQA